MDAEFEIKTMNKKKTAKIVISVIVIGSAVGYLLCQAIDSSWAYYYSVDEFVCSDQYKSSDDTVSALVRLAGRVDSIIHDAENMQLDFELAGQKNSLPVSYHGPVPRNFTAGKEVVVHGKADPNGLFKAVVIMTRCESKYRVKLQPGLSNPKETIE